MEPIMMKAAEIERLSDAEVRATDQIVKQECERLS